LVAPKPLEAAAPVGILFWIKIKGHPVARSLEKHHESDEYQ
jgi:hypothetical protein